MLKDIIRKEIVETITSPKFVFTFLLCAVLILLSVYTGITNYAAEQKEYNAAVALNEKSLESQTNYGRLQPKVNRPPHVLSAISIGVDEAVGRTASVNTVLGPTLVESKYEGNLMFAVFGALDLTFIVKIVLSLFAILFTYDAIVGEKERGTLKLTLSNKVPRDRLILGKVIGGYISLLIPLIIPLILSVLILMVYPNIHLTGGDWGRLLLIFLIFFLYLSVFFTLGLFISARTSKSSTSFLVLLFIWVVFVTVIPKVAVMSAAQIKPIPSIHEITSQKHAFLQRAAEANQKDFEEWNSKNPPKPGGDEKAYEEKSNKFFEDEGKKYISQMDAYNAALERDYQTKKRAQQNLAINLSRLSPASALTFSTMSLARTGFDENQRFLDSIRAYIHIFTNWVNDKMFRSRDFENGGANRKVNLSDMPLHSFTSESLSKSLARTIPDIVLMIVLIIVFFVGAYVSFLKYDVR